jgi:redox-sensitive bicupin YhaK (pirin superfamily)
MPGRDRHLHDRRGSSGTQDSNGGGGLITDGYTQWMTAGAGLSFALITLLTSTASSAFLSLPCAVPSKSN